jgi:Mg-chelatase subunit ChlD
MNIMENLGFNKRGVAQDNEPAKENEKGLFEFTDKNPRDQSETRIYNLIILDESGSMMSIRNQALTGVNETIQTIRTAQQENPDDHQMLCFVTFDQGGNRPDVRVIIDNEKIENVEDIKPYQYHPNGCTPLYDAMGLSITALQKLVKEGDHVLVTVVTDGYENASHIYTAAMIKELVESLSQKGWVFAYIGANQDSEQTASGLGISSTMDFEADAMGTAMMWEKMRSSNREYYKKVRYSKMSGESIDYNEDFFSQKQAMNRVTPNRITHLEEGQVFVFGSNAEGYHDGGAAHFAMERFGAIYGQGRGLQGRSYAIPTMSGSLQEIAYEVQDFILFADQHPELTFLVTRIGCGIAGYTDRDIAPLFAGAYSLPNVYLPAEFWKVLNYKFK